MVREIHASVMASVDGFHADLSGSYTFAAAGASEVQALQARELLRSYDTFVFGRVTYERGEASWATEEARRTRHPELVAAMNTRPRLLFSRTTSEAAWGPTVIHPDGLTDVITRLKGEKGRNVLVIGSASVRTALLDAGLLDRVMVTYVPVALGEGRPVFEGSRVRRSAKTRRVTALAGGAVTVEYQFGQIP